jgi:hypothetical protein
VVACVVSLIEGGENTFVPGLVLNRAFYAEVLAPLLRAHFPGVEHSAALLGEGSDVLGYDNERSMDHNWGPRALIFLSPKDHEKYAKKIDRMFRRYLPYTFRGFSTNFTPPRQTYLVQSMESIDRGPVNHMVKMHTVRGFCDYYLGFGMNRKPSIEDWLTFPQQALCEVTAGEVFYDGLGELTRVREELAYYPDDVWRYLLMCQWVRIANELSYQARSGERDDELGSRVIAARMVEEIVKMAFLQERRYMPYSKWRGTAFMRLPIASALQGPLLCAMKANSWRERQDCLGAAYQVIGERHNELGLTRPISTALSDFHGRGYTVLDVGPFIQELKRSIKTRRLRAMRFPIGGVDQFINHSRINHENYLHRELVDIIR